MTDPSPQVDLLARVLAIEMRDRLVKDAARVILRWVAETDAPMPAEVAKAREILKTTKENDQ